MTSIYKTISCNMNGNCLFEAMSYLLHNDASHHERLRFNLANFYNSFDITAEYPEGSLNYAIAMGLLYDNEDDNGNIHSINIENPFVWGSPTDIIALALLGNINIELYYSNTDLLDPEPFVYNSTITVPTATITKKLAFINNNHYEPLVKKTEEEIIESRALAHLKKEIDEAYNLTGFFKTPNEETRTMKRDLMKEANVDVTSSVYKMTSI